MAVNPTYLGKTYPSTPEYEVGREAIRDFATAIGDTDPAYHNVDFARELGHPDIIAPPTFPFVLTMKAMAMAMFDPDLGLNYALVVHGEEDFEYVRPIHAGDRLSVSTEISDISTKGRNEFVTTKSEVTTTAGDLVCTTHEVIVSRGTAEGAE